MQVNLKIVQRKSSYHVSVILGVVADHVPPAGWHVGALDRPEPDDLLVCVGEQLHGVGLPAGVDPLIKGAEDDLPEVEAAGVGAPGGHQLVQEILGDWAVVLLKKLRMTEKIFRIRMTLCFSRQFSKRLKEKCISYRSNHHDC